MTKFTITREMYQSVDLFKIVHPEENNKIISSIKEDDPMIIIENFKLNDLINILDRQTNVRTYRFVRPKDVIVRSWETEINLPKDVRYHEDVSHGEAADEVLKDLGTV